MSASGLYEKALSTDVDDERLIIEYQRVGFAVFTVETMFVSRSSRSIDWTPPNWDGW
jgi:hypothetical protein